MTTSGERATHWDTAYRTHGVKGVSWLQTEPVMSLRLIRLLGVDRSTPLIDIGGGASSLVDHLVADGFVDVTVLDVSEVALAESRQRIGATPAVRWLHEDLLSWRPAQRFGLWHDRAVFHFLTDVDDRVRYLATLKEALRPGAGIVMATFADDGPEYCSGLPVTRYSADELVDFLGEDFSVAEVERELHSTPTGTVQPFTWVSGTYR